MPEESSGYGSGVPRPTDIPFDHAAATVAVAALDRAAAVLADVADGRIAAGDVARQHFRGVYAEDFARSDHDLGAASADARLAAAALRNAIVSAAEAALRAQVARAGDQRAWDAAHAHPPPVGIR
jgi:hypothetical protein